MNTEKLLFGFCISLCLLMAAMLAVTPASAETPTNQSNITDTTPLFSWAWTDDANTNYTLKIDNNMDLGTPLLTVADIQDTFYTLNSTQALADGQYYWGADVYVDQAYNDTTETYNFFLDSTPPSPGTLTINSGASYTDSGTLQLSWSGFSDAGIGLNRYYYSLTNNEGNAIAAYKEHPQTTANLSANQGNRTVYVWASDILGNIGYATSSWIVIDTTSPSFGSWSESPSPLRYDHEDIFNISVTVTENNLLSPPQCMYRFNGTSYNARQSLTLLSGQRYSFIIDEDWESFAGWTLYYACNVTDVAGHSTNTTRSEYIIANQNSPQFLNLDDITATQDSNRSFTINAEDADDDQLTFTCSHPDITITSLDSDSAKASWIPGNDDVGDNQVTFYVSDGTFTTNKTITITVEGINDPPALESIGNLETYLHQPFIHYIYATDPDNENDAEIDDNYAGIFSVADSGYSWFKIQSMFNFSNDEYVGRINFTPLLSHKGIHNITIKISDGEGYDTENILFTVGYCGDKDLAGDPKCDSEYEDCNSCPVDCGKCEEDTPEALAIITQKRNCLYTNFTMRTYELYERASCETEGEIIGNLEVCGNLSGASITAYSLIDKEWVEMEQFITDEDGKVSFVPTTAGSYKMVGKYKSYKTAIKYLDFRECIDIAKETQNSSSTQQNNTIAKPEDDKDKNNTTKSPKEDEPAGIDGEEIKEASIFLIIIYFIVIPLISMALIAGSYFYYHKEKNNKPWILKARIWTIQKKKVVAYHTKRYWRRFKDLIGF